MFKRLARLAIPSLPHLRFRAAAEFRRFRAEVPHLGWPAALRLAWERCFARGKRLRSIRLPGYRQPLFYRTATSDADVIHQVFVRREYECGSALPGIEFIIDCGANIGTSAWFLLHRYPAARMVVVEPDAGNMAICRRNLAAFRDRVTFVQAGVWPSSGELVVERGSYADGQEWSFQVRPANPGEEADVTAATVTDLMAAGGFPRIDLLKVDIEAAEKELFGKDYDSWLRLTRNLVIELHGDECDSVVSQALKDYSFTRSRFGELTLFRGISPKEHSPCS